MSNGIPPYDRQALAEKVDRIVAKAKDNARNIGYPDPHMPHPPNMPEIGEEPYTEWHSWLNSHGEGAEDYLYKRFDRFAVVDPSSIDNDLADLDAAIEALSTARGLHIANIHPEIDGWDGDAADAFQLWVTRVGGSSNAPADVDGQVPIDAFGRFLDLAVASKVALLDHKGIVEAAWHDANNIADDTLAALEDVDGANWVALAKIAVATIGLIATATASPAAGWAIAGAAASLLVATAEGVAAQDLRAVEGGDVIDVLTSMDTALGQLRLMVQDREAAVRQVLADISDAMSGHSNRESLLPPLPNLPTAEFRIPAGAVVG